MLKGILIIAFMLIIMALMATKKMPTVIALLVLAIGICIIAGVPFMAKDADGKAIGWFDTVLVTGATRLASNYVIAIFAGWLGCMMITTGIMRTMIKKGAELGGDRMLVVHLILYVLATILMSVVTGLGGAIMIGTIVIPILIAVGVDKMTAAVSFLFAKGIGVTFALSNIKTYSTMTGMEFEAVNTFSYIISAIGFIAGIVYIYVNDKKTGKKMAFSAPAAEEVEGEMEVKGVLGALSMLTPILPPFLVTVFKLPIIPALIIGVIWATLTTCWSLGWSRTMNMLSKTFIEGFEKTAPAGCLMIVIGMLLAAINLAPVKTALEPFMSAVAPKSLVTFLLFFIVLAPLCLYRGPFNLWGLGAGICALFVGLNLMTPAQAMVGFVSVTVMQSICCPTNTHNVWVAGFSDNEVTAITMKQLPYVWPAVALMIIIGTVMYIL